MVGESADGEAEGGDIYELLEQAIDWWGQQDTLDAMGV
jgi:hypothetical protein